MLIILLKCLILQRRGKWKSNPESVSGNGLPPKVNHNLPTGRLNHNAELLKSPDYVVSNPADRQTHKQDRLPVHDFLQLSLVQVIIKYHSAV